LKISINNTELHGYELKPLLWIPTRILGEVNKGHIFNGYH